MQNLLFGLTFKELHNENQNQTHIHNRIKLFQDKQMEPK